MSAATFKPHPHGCESTVVVVDLDGTVIPDLPAMRTAAAAVLDTLPLCAGSITAEHPLVDDLLRVARQRWRASPIRSQPEALGVSSWEALWSNLEHQDPTTSPQPTPHAVAVWHDILSTHHGDPGHARTAAHLLITHREALVHPYPGSRDALARLSGDHRLWLVTHGSSPLQRRKLHLAGLNQYFERIYISAEVGHLKDTPAFAALLHRHAHDTGQQISAVIGDSTSDLTLATHGGWPAIHICPAPCTHQDPHVRHRRTLADIPPID